MRDEQLQMRRRNFPMIFLSTDLRRIEFSVPSIFGDDEKLDAEIYKP